VKNKIESRELDVRHLKMFIIDECDEVLNNSKEILG
jgi:superfamily II DNA/RNA helicase